MQSKICAYTCRESLLARESVYIYIYIYVHTSDGSLELHEIVNCLDTGHARAWHDIVMFYRRRELWTTCFAFLFVYLNCVQRDTYRKISAAASRLKVSFSSVVMKGTYAERTFWHRCARRVHAFAVDISSKCLHSDFSLVTLHFILENDLAHVCGAAT